MNIKQKIFILLIALGIVLRFVKLDYSPPHLSNDEISIAYDAYSILYTGRDQHNHVYPLSFESFETYKAPLAIYLSVPTTALLGNNDYSVRLPSAIFGSLTVIFLGLLVYELTQNTTLSLLSSLLLSLSPWHIYTSRMALESNIALFFVVLGIYLFFKALHKKNIAATIGSFVSFALSIYGYHTEWGFTPLLIFLILFLNRKTIFRKPVYVLGLVLFLVLVTPIFMDAIKNIGTDARANTEIILKDPYVNAKLHENLNIFQKGDVLVNKFISNYSSYNSPRFLFFTGLDLLPSDDPFQIGLFLAPLLPLFLLGLVKIKKYFSDQYLFIYGWIIISPIIPALTIGDTNQVRDIVAVAPYTIVIAVGLIYILDAIKNKVGRGVIWGILAVSFMYFSIIYFYHFPFEKGVNFQYGYKQMAQFIKPGYDQYQKIIVDPRFGEGGIYAGVPHLYIPYYTKLDPNILLDNRTVDYGIAFGKYEFRNIDWKNEPLGKSYLFAVPVSNLPDPSILSQLRQVDDIQLPNHTDAFRIYETLK